MEANLQFNFISEISKVSQNFKGILLDAYGVFWSGNDSGAIPGSKDTMETLVSEGKIVGILSNSTQLSSKEIDKLQKQGICQGKHFHFLVTSGEVARHIFLNLETAVQGDLESESLLLEGNHSQKVKAPPIKSEDGSKDCVNLSSSSAVSRLKEKLPFETPLKRFWLFGGAHPKFSTHEAIFKDTPFQESANIEEADFIFVSVPHIKGEDQTSTEPFQEQINKLKMINLPMVCANPDAYAHEGKPARAVVRQGSIAALYEQMGGKVFYIGKPYARAFEFAMAYFQKFKINDPKEILMVGDTPETDIRGARKFGMSSALVTETGIMGDRIKQEGSNQAVQNLPASDLPDFFIRRF